MTRSGPDELVLAVFEAAANALRPLADMVDTANVANAAAAAGAPELTARRARGLEPSAVAPAVLASVASLYAAAGHKDAAHRLLPAFADLHDARADLHEQLGEEAQAVRELAAIAPERRPARRGLAATTALRGALERAVGLIEQLPEDGPAAGRTRACLGIAHLAIRAGQGDVAKAWLARAEHAALRIGAAERGSEALARSASAELLGQAAKEWLELTRPDEALRLAHCADELTASPGRSARRRKYDERWHETLAEVYERCGEKRLADRIFAHRADLLGEGHTVAGDAVAARMYAEHGRRDEALRLLTTHLARLDAADDAIEQQMAATYVGLGDIGAAIEHDGRIRDPHPRADAPGHIGQNCHEHSVERTPAIDAALARLSSIDPHLSG